MERQKDEGDVGSCLRIEVEGHANVIGDACTLRSGPIKGDRYAASADSLVDGVAQRLGEQPSRERGACDVAHIEAGTVFSCKRLEGAEGRPRRLFRSNALLATST